MDSREQHGTPRRFAVAVLRSILSWLVVSGLLGGAVALYALLIEPNRVVVEHVTHEMDPRSPAGREGAFRIAFVSDFDMLDPPGRHELRARDAVNALDADLVAVGGDFFSGDEWKVPETWMPAFREYLAGFRARHGMVVAWGEQEKAWAAQIAGFFPPGVREIDDRCEVLATSAQRPAGSGGAARVRVCGPEGLFPSLAIDPAGGGRVLAGWGRSLVAARCTVPGADRWSAVEVTARLSLGAAGDGPGISVLEAPGRPGYRLRVIPDAYEWGLVWREKQIWSGRTRDRTVFVQPRRAYDVRVRVEPGPAATIVRSRIWPAGTPEPQAWPLEIADTFPGRPRQGAVALVAGGSWSGGNQQAFEFVEVRDLSGRLLFKDEFDDAARFRAEWDNPGGEPDAYDATVVIAHNPEFLLDMPQLPRPPMDLVLAGHTHGGQVRLWPFGPLHLGDGLPRNWSAGLVRLEKMRGWLYVTRGVGTGKIPIRLFCPPEVTDLELTLRRRPAL